VYRWDFELSMGYPEEDIGWFISKTRSDVYDEVLEELDEYKLKYIDLVGYIPKPEQENIDRAVEKGRWYLEVLRRADEIFDSDVGEKLIEVQMKS